MIEGPPRVVYFALRPLRTGGVLLPEGSIIPEASSWKNIHMNISQGQVAPLPTWLLTPEQQEGIALALGLVEPEPSPVDEAEAIVEQEADVVAQEEITEEAPAEPAVDAPAPEADAPVAAEEPQEAPEAAKAPIQPKGRSKR